MPKTAIVNVIDENDLKIETTYDGPPNQGQHHGPWASIISHHHIEIPEGVSEDAVKAEKQKAYREWSLNEASGQSDLKLEAVADWVYGANPSLSISVPSFIEPPTEAPTLQISVANRLDISISTATDVDGNPSTTIQDVIDAINNDEAASALVIASLSAGATALDIVDTNIAKERIGLDKLVKLLEDPDKVAQKKSDKWDAIKAERDAKLVASDAKWIEKKSKAEDATAIEAYKQELRDLPANIQVEFDALASGPDIEAYEPTWPTEPA